MSPTISNPPKMLLHVCCAGCSPYVIDLLQQEYDVTCLFYNPNIHPEGEYQLRISEVRKLANEHDIVLLNGTYDADEWFARAQGLEHEPEGGRRCEMCFRMRLERTAQFACENDFDTFTTTLTISPHKNADTINSIGNEMAEKYGVHFKESNFKKKDGFKKTTALCKELGLYRQDYCGCVYSKKSDT